MIKFIRNNNILSTMIFTLFFAGNAIAMERFDTNKKINFAYQINYNNFNQNNNFLSNSKLDISSTNELFQKDKFGKIVSFNEEKIKNEKILDFVGMFTSRYDSRRKLRFKVRLDNDYNLQSALISYKFQY
ncbi:hypothetical protein OAP83_02355 [Rickettsiales bacterium]|nr:hypothetical protein [Rickettsiales bacterium]